MERDEQGQPLLLRGVSIDITSRKLAEEEAAAQTRKLEHLSRVAILGELAGSIAHELNQPLAALLSNAQAGKRFLKQSPPALEEIPPILDDIEADAKRAGGIIHGMRAMLKKDAPIVATEVNLNTCIGQVLSLLNGEILASRVSIHTHLDDSLPLVRAGHVEMQQVLVNLLVNALEILKSIQTERLVEIRTTHLEGAAQVTVRDTGPGFSEKMLPRLFEPFVSTKPGGLGLGLVISRSIVEQFRGKMTAENHSAGGAVFCITLPVSTAKTQA
jgi:C4-dicarboxylate-specific signal transduction histidine kinase